MSGRAWRRLLLGASMALAAGACGGSSGHAAPTTSRPPGTAVTTTTLAGTQGPRTVLSPIGINVRAEPNRSAKVLGTAAQGVVLTALGQTSGSGGWFEVKGATVTGWISDDPTLTAPGEFRTYSSAQFNALYPAAWSAAALPPSSVVFRPGSGAEDIVVTAAPSAAALPSGRAGYGRNSSSQVIVCGVTSDLVTYQRATSAPAAAALPYLVQVRLTLDQQHALGVDANLSDLGSQLQVLRAILASLTFSSPQCAGK